MPRRGPWIALWVMALTLAYFARPWAGINCHGESLYAHTQSMVPKIHLDDRESALAISIMRGALKSSGQSPADPPAHFPERFSLRDRRQVWVRLFLEDGQSTQVGRAEGNLYRSIREATLEAFQSLQSTATDPIDRDEIGLVLEIETASKGMWMRSPAALAFFVEPGVHGLRVGDGSHQAELSPWAFSSQLAAQGVDAPIHRGQAIAKALDGLSMALPQGNPKEWQGDDLEISVLKTQNLAQSRPGGAIWQPLRRRNGARNLDLERALTQGRAYLAAQAKRADLPFAQRYAVERALGQPSTLSLDAESARRLGDHCADYALDIVLTLRLWALDHPDAAYSRDLLHECEGAIQARLAAHVAGDGWPRIKGAPPRDLQFTAEGAEILEQDIPIDHLDAPPQCRQCPGKALLALGDGRRKTSTAPAPPPGAALALFELGPEDPAVVLAQCRWSWVNEDPAGQQACLKAAKGLWRRAYPVNLPLYADYQGQIHRPAYLPETQALPALLHLFTQLATASPDHPYFTTQAHQTARGLMRLQWDEYGAAFHAVASPGAFDLSRVGGDASLFTHIRALRALEAYAKALGDGEITQP